VSPRTLAGVLVAAAWVTVLLDNWRLQRRQDGDPPLIVGERRPPLPARAGLLLAILGTGALLETRGTQFALPWPLAFAGVVLAAGGAALHVVARRALGEAWSDVPGIRLGQQLVARGPYLAVRHPIYAGLLLLAGGTVLAHPSIATMCGAGGLVVGIAVKIRREERLLRRAFGSAYDDYVGRVPALWPGIAGLRRWWARAPITNDTPR